MSTEFKIKITIEATVNAPIDKVWKCWTTPGDIMAWNHATDDWHCPKASNDLRAGGVFCATMAARDGSFSFDFEGIYDEVRPYEVIAYTLGDGRKVITTFGSSGNQTHIVSTFEAEETNSPEMQRDGWQAILNNFKSYAEGA